MFYALMCMHDSPSFVSVIGIRALWMMILFGPFFAADANYSERVWLGIALLQLTCLSTNKRGDAFYDIMVGLYILFHINWHYEYLLFSLVNSFYVMKISDW